MIYYYFIFKQHSLIQKFTSLEIALLSGLLKVYNKKKNRGKWI